MGEVMELTAMLLMILVGTSLALTVNAFMANTFMGFLRRLLGAGMVLTMGLLIINVAASGKPSADAEYAQYSQADAARAQAIAEYRMKRDSRR